MGVDEETPAGKYEKTRKPSETKDLISAGNATPTKSKIWRLQTSDWIALAALLLSLYAAGTKIWENHIGPELMLISPANRVVELRCVASVTTCIGAENGSSGPRGRLSVILPFYFVNTGAIGQNEIISRLWINVDAEGKKIPDSLDALFPVTLYAISDWKRTESGRGPSTPFAPILVEGRNAAGAEYRAIDFDQVDRVPWDLVTAAIIEGSVTGLSITLHARTELEGVDLTETCRVQFGDTQRAALERRISERNTQYVATICMD